MCNRRCKRLCEMWRHETAHRAVVDGAEVGAKRGQGGHGQDHRACGSVGNDQAKCKGPSLTCFVGPGIAQGDR